jgi:hypothetical protein
MMEVNTLTLEPTLFSSLDIALIGLLTGRTDDHLGNKMANCQN